MVFLESEARPVGVIWTLNLDEPTPMITPLVAATFRNAGRESITALATASAENSSAEIEERLERGRRCFTAWVGEALAAYGWVSFDEEFIGELGLRLRLLPGEAYIWNCVTLPRFRQNYLYSALLSYMLSELRGDPLCRAWIGADFDNIPSQRGIARAGFRRVAELMVVSVGTGRLAWIQGMPDAPESLVAEARRAFLDNREQVRLKEKSDLNA
jgi:hypothetical protein